MQLMMRLCGMQPMQHGSSQQWQQQQQAAVMMHGCLKKRQLLSC
jgi:hypothetical protein